MESYGGGECIIFAFSVFGAPCIVVVVGALWNNLYVKCILPGCAAQRFQLANKELKGMQLIRQRHWMGEMQL